MNTTMKEFAERNRLRVNDKKLAEKCRLAWAPGDPVVPGRYGEIAEFNDFGESEFRLRLLAVPRSAVMTKALLSRRRAALQGGLRLKWKGDAESIFYFDPNNQAEAELAIKLVGARTKRRATSETRERLTKQLTAARGALKRPFLPKQPFETASTATQ